MKDRYVQHISGQGARWLLTDNSSYNAEPHDEWCIYRPGVNCITLFLPKSEYVLCEPEEHWENVTADVYMKYRYELESPFNKNMGEFLTYNTVSIAKLVCGANYRIRKVKGQEILASDEVIIVEKRTP